LIVFYYKKDLTRLSWSLRQLVLWKRRHVSEQI